MERGRKRKAVSGASPEHEPGSAKRQKGMQRSNNVVEETNESTTAIGLRFLQQLKEAKDKTGRLIADLFMELPAKKDLPDYYQAIRLPIAIETIQDKLDRQAYANLTEIESDLKRMVANAKLYNDDKSEVYGDAERIRKMVSNYMTKNNPAYKDPEYTAFATPIPGEEKVNGASRGTPRASTKDPSEPPRKPTVTLSLKGTRDRKTSLGAALGASEEPAGTGEYSGMTFAQAQEQIVNDLIRHTDDDGLEIFQPFANLPPRSLTDYYQVIKKPVSLAALRKRTRGQHGREAATGISDFRSWDAFEEEASYIWSNAREYNEDGSEMFDLAGEFEKVFHDKLALAKEQVEEPSRPSIKLNARPKPTIHLGHKASPVPNSTPGVTVDSEALARQASLVQAGVNGHRTAKTQESSVPPSRSSSQVPAATAQERAQSGQAASPPVPTIVKSEKSAAPSLSQGIPPAHSLAPDARQTSQPVSSMPPPPRIPSGSPHPAQQATTYIPAHVPVPPTFAEVYTRTKPISEALLPSLMITSHPQLQRIPKPLRLDIPPSPEYTQQSLTIQLPASHYYIQITPTVSPQLMSGRQYKLFVTVNGVRLMASNKEAPLINGDMTNGQAAAVVRKPTYETALTHGVNRIEVEIAAVPSGRGGPLEVEKLSVFTHLMRT